MAKTSSKQVTNLLRVSGILFGVSGLFHILRYFFLWEFRVGGFELTPAGSLAVGLLLASLSAACFLNSRK